MRSRNIVYMLSVAINRGFIIIYSFALINLIDAKEFGDFYLFYMISQILSVFIIFNGTNSIIRFGSIDSNKALVVLNKILFFSFVFALCLSIGSSLLGAYIISFIFIQAYFESLIKLLHSYYRTRDDIKSYFITSIIKTIPLSVLFVLMFYDFGSDNLYLNLSILYILGVLFVFFTIKSLINKRFFKLDKKKDKEVILFSLFLIPHIISQWIMNASDKLFIKYYESPFDLGRYTYYYNIAMIFLFINSFLSVVYPSHFIKNYTAIHRSGNHISLLYKYSIFYACILFGVVLMIGIDLKYIQYLPYMCFDTFIIFYIVGVSYYYLGLYYLLANYFIYEKKPGVISKISTFSMIINIISTFFLVLQFGFKGGAYATLLTYLIYFLMVYFSVYFYKFVSRRYLWHVFLCQMFFVIYSFVLFEIFTRGMSVV